GPAARVERLLVMAPPRRPRRGRDHRQGLHQPADGARPPVTAGREPVRATGAGRGCGGGNGSGMPRGGTRIPVTGPSPPARARGRGWGVQHKGKEITMDAGLTLYGNPVAAKFAKHITSAGAVVTSSTLPAATQELVKIRASQINGCAACTDMHTKDAQHAGES